MVGLATCWNLDLNRGPNWLMVRLVPDGQQCDADELADQLERLLEQHFTYRLVLELDRLELLTSLLLGQLVDLEDRVRDHGGVLRLCGLTSDNQEVLRATHLESRLQHFADRVEAVRGFRPAQPR